LYTNERNLQVVQREYQKSALVYLTAGELPSTPNALGYIDPRKGKQSVQMNACSKMGAVTAPRTERCQNATAAGYSDERNQ
jgi:hypothetical protein